LSAFVLCFCAVFLLSLSLSLHSLTRLTRSHTLSLTFTLDTSPPSPSSHNLSLIPLIPLCMSVRNHPFFLPSLSFAVRCTYLSLSALHSPAHSSHTLASTHKPPSAASPLSYWVLLACLFFFAPRSFRLCFVSVWCRVPLALRLFSSLPPSLTRAPSAGCPIHFVLGCVLLASPRPPFIFTCHVALGRSCCDRPRSSPFLSLLFTRFTRFGFAACVD
jgi:hypothetical protein